MTNTMLSKDHIKTSPMMYTKFFHESLEAFFLFVRYMQIAVVLVDVCESCGAIESIVGHS